MDVKQKSGSEMIETDVSEGFHLENFPFSSFPCFSILKNTVIMCTPPFFLLGGSLSLYLNFHIGGGLAETQFLEGGCWERGGDFFREGCSFYIKNELKSEILNNKKSL